MFSIILCSFLMDSLSFCFLSGRFSLLTSRLRLLLWSDVRHCLQLKNVFVSAVKEHRDT